MIKHTLISIIFLVIIASQYTYAKAKKEITISLTEWGGGAIVKKDNSYRMYFIRSRHIYDNIALIHKALAKQRIREICRMLKSVPETKNFLKKRNNGNDVILIEYPIDSTDMVVFKISRCGSSKHGAILSTPSEIDFMDGVADINMGGETISVCVNETEKCKNIQAKEGRGDIIVNIDSEKKVATIID